MVWNKPSCELGCLKMKRKLRACLWLRAPAYFIPKGHGLRDSFTIGSWARLLTSPGLNFISEMGGPDWVLESASGLQPLTQILDFMEFRERVLDYCSSRTKITPSERWEWAEEMTLSPCLIVTILGDSQNTRCLVLLHRTDWHAWFKSLSLASWEWAEFDKHEQKTLLQLCPQPLGTEVIDVWGSVRLVRRQALPPTPLFNSWFLSSVLLSASDQECWLPVYWLKSLPCLKPSGKCQFSLRDSFQWLIRQQKEIQFHQNLNSPATDWLQEKKSYP